jgi:hypothetical protein
MLLAFRKHSEKEIELLLFYFILFNSPEEPTVYRLCPS